MQIGFGGGCHWCTEAVFQALLGVYNVEQGHIKSLAPHESYSEAVVVTFNPDLIPLEILVNVHVLTHASTSLHKMRDKYRSAVYVYSESQAAVVQGQIKAFQKDFEAPIITIVLPFNGFKPSPEQFRDYYRSNADKPFCKAYINPKLSKIRQQFSRYCHPANT
ncbi:peptide-methionine (S)-S-oxide reductase [Litoreibacter meonggei]|uniref:peptide-methionine (S)-S-oxide reductase n=1 Tax=Litoreibacter meonggei TaxID=1049199 RepID=A0A497WSZ8_9RHOB|nr:peptide-methionine (S)-S-oxide reductase [Litoreibacter meonggei]RLJ59938.1 peptide-methionine (S)-S-oxide reductase [Litoreibacter meonggei]